MSTRVREREIPDPKWLLKVLLLWSAWILADRIATWVDRLGWMWGEIPFLFFWMGLIVAVVVLKKWKVLWPGVMFPFFWFVAWLSVDLFHLLRLYGVGSFIVRHHFNIVLQVALYGLMLALIARHQGEKRWWRWSYPAVLFLIRFPGWRDVVHDWPSLWIRVFADFRFISLYVLAVLLPVFLLWCKHRKLTPPTRPRTSPG
ncbi:MAG: hypothetical protein FWB76_00820 [Oscillospiraceae bacterium]|nr:hypothetical protein [Oscillospiraceae bacterium]